MPDTPLQGRLLRIEHSTLDGAQLFRVTDVLTGEAITSVQRVILTVSNAHTATPTVSAELVIDGIPVTITAPQMLLELAMEGA